MGYQVQITKFKKENYFTTKNVYLTDEARDFEKENKVLYISYFDSVAVHYISKGDLGHFVERLRLLL